MVTILGVVAIIIALIYCFFGYRLARIVLPLCGTLVICAFMYVFLIDFYTSGNLDKWIFILCCAVALYVILFLLKRFAGFIVGVCGAAMALLFLATASNIDQQPYFYAAAISVCLIVGLISFVYKRVGIIIATSLFGGCLATIIALFLIFGGVTQISEFSDLTSKVYGYLANNAAIITGIALSLAVVGVLVQLFGTGGTTILAGRHGFVRKTQRFVSDEISTTNSGSTIL